MNEQQQEQKVRAHAHPTAGYIAVAPFPDPEATQETEHLTKMVRAMGLQIIGGGAAAPGIGAGVVREVGPHLGEHHEEFEKDHVVYYPMVKAWDVGDGYHYVMAAAVICHRRPDED